MPLCFVVDDHVDTREGFAEYLRQSGFDVRDRRRMPVNCGRFWPK